MAIDFGRMARGVATGYLSAKIANTEANDRLKEDIIRQSGENFYNNTLPEFQKREKNRENTYNQVSKIYGNDVAEYFDQSGFITGQANDFSTINDMLSENNNFNRDKLKAYLEAVEGGTYSSRKEKRFSSIADQEKFVMGNLTKNGFGTNTLMSQLGRDTTEEQPMAPAETQAVAPVPPEMAEDTTTTKLPSFEEIFGTTSEDRVFKNLDREDQMPIRNRALSEFNALFRDELTGDVRVAPAVKDAYERLPEPQKRSITLSQFAFDNYFKNLDREDQMPIRNRALSEFNALFRDELTGDVRVAPAVKDAYERLPEPQKRSITLSQFAFDNYFKNTFLPDNNYTFEKSLPADIVEAKQLINQFRSEGDDEKVKIVKQRLIDAGYDISDYNL
jgi:uncharacterized protein (UPF0335 family)